MTFLNLEHLNIQRPMIKISQAVNVSGGTRLQSGRYSV